MKCNAKQHLGGTCWGTLNKLKAKLRPCVAPTRALLSSQEAPEDDARQGMLSLKQVRDTAEYVCVKRQIIFIFIIIFFF